MYNLKHHGIICEHVKDGKKKKKFAVCVKGLDFPHQDISVRLVEWIELLNILGADKVCNKHSGLRLNYSCLSSHALWKCSKSFSLEVTF